MRRSSSLLEQYSFELSRTSEVQPCVKFALRPLGFVDVEQLDVRRWDLNFAEVDACSGN